MKVYILDDYDYDCVIQKEDDLCGKPFQEELYEVPDSLVEEYEKINKRRDELKEKILQIRLQTIRFKLANNVSGVKPKGFD